MSLPQDPHTGPEPVTPTANSAPLRNAQRAGAPAQTPWPDDLSPRPQQPHRSSAARLLQWLAGCVLALVLVAGLGWWWAGQSTSLATALERAAQWLPAGQTLQSRDVSGSLRRGGHIGWLRWSSPTLTVEVTDARLGWQLPALLQRRLELSEVSAARVQIIPAEQPEDAPKPPPSPTEPQQQLLLPLAVDLPLRVDTLQWGADAAAPTVQINGLAGHYRFDGQNHQLQIAQLALAQGQYTAQATLQGAAPMALQARVDGTVTTALPGRTEALTAQAHARVEGTLATVAARLQLQAELLPDDGITPAPATATAKTASTPPSTLPGKSSTPQAAMRATVQATVLPWAQQPLQQASATLQALNLAALWPQAPATQLHGTLNVGVAPDEAGQPTRWRLGVDVANLQSGPWDAQRLPLSQLSAQATYDGTRWSVPSATATVGKDSGNGAAAGSVTLQGQFTTATQVFEGQAALRNLSPDALHSALAAAPLSGTVQARVVSNATQAVRFTADIRAARPGTPAKAGALRVDAFTAQGQWSPHENGGTAHIDSLTLDALQAHAQATDLRISLGEAKADVASPPQRAVAAQGLLNLRIPGSDLRLQGHIAPRAGKGEAALRVGDADQSLRWLAALPWLGKAMQPALQGITAKGQAQLQAQWTGGWQSLQQQLAAAQNAAPGTTTGAGNNAGPFSVQATLTSPQLDTQLPAGEGSNTATHIQWRGIKAELQGQITQASLTLEGEARSGTQRLTVQTRVTGGAGGAGSAGSTGAAAGLGHWQAQWQTLRAQWQDTRRPGAWTAQLTSPLAMSVRMQPPAQATNGKRDTRSHRDNPANPPAQPSRMEIQASAGQAQVTGPQPGTVQLRWQPLRLATGGGTAPRLQTQGTLQGLPLAWVDALGTATEPVPVATPAAAPLPGAAPSPTAPMLAPQPLLARLGLSTNLLLDGEWNVDTMNTPDTPRATASLRRTQGDLRILGGESPAGAVSVSSGQGLGTGSVTAMATAAAGGTAAGVRQAELSVQLQGDALSARLQWASARAGEIDASASTRLQWGAQDASGALWAADAPLAGTVRARLPDVGVWSALAPPGWRVRGTLDANATLSGTRNAPRWAGTLAADDLAVRSLIDGVDLQGGRLRATLRGNQVELTEFQLQGGRGSKARITGQSGNRTPAPEERGTLSATGRLGWSDADAATGAPPRITLNLQAQAKALQVLVRADRQVSVSGTLQARLEQGQFSLTGQLTTDRATIILPDESAPSLGSDVVVRSAARDRQAQASAQAAGRAQQKAEQEAARSEPAGASGNPQLVPAKPPVMAVTLNLGRDFALQGRGITTRLTGEVELRSSPTPGAPPRVTGEVRTEEGRYRAWGQVLDVETGLIRFNGPYNNPSLDILALRPNISVRAGVQVTGSALAPRVRLYSDPELPDAEKLAWVVLGRDATAGGAEAAVLQQAALALLGNRGQSVTANLANRVGLDEIGFKGAAAGEDASSAALTFGKRISKDLYVTYERTLSGTLGALYIFYDLSRRLTLRGQAGSNSALDLIYTMKYD